MKEDVRGFRLPIHIYSVRFLSCNIIIVLFSIAISAGGVFASERLECLCPLSSSGWTVYPDSAFGAPDFYQRSHVDVQQVLFCHHGINLFFRAHQNGRRLLTCLTVAKPSFRQLIESSPSDSSLGDSTVQDLEQRLEYQIYHYDLCLDGLRNVLGEKFIEDVVVEFKTGWLAKPPKLHLGRDLRLKYNKNDVILRGLINIYFKTESS